MKKLILTLLAAMVCVTFGACAVQPQGEDSQYKARIISVADESYTDEEAGKYYYIQYLTVEFTEGPYAGQTHETDVFIDATNYTDIALYRVGDTIEASVSAAEDGILNVSVVTLVRIPYVIILAVIFLALIGIIGRKKGIKTITGARFYGRRRGVCACAAHRGRLSADPISRACMYRGLGGHAVCRGRVQQKSAGQRAGHSQRSCVRRRHHTHFQCADARHRHRHLRSRNADDRRHGRGISLSGHTHSRYPDRLYRRRHGRRDVDIIIDERDGNN